MFEKSFLIRDGRLVGVSLDAERRQLEFLKDASTVNRVYIDPSGFLQIPEKVKNATAIKDVAELEIHPSRKFAMLWNPELTNKEKVMETMQQDPETWIERDVNLESKKEELDLTFDSVADLFKRQFNFPKKTKPYIKIKNLHKGYKIFGSQNKVIKGIDLDIQEGDFVFISGPSGVGKTTLLNLIAGLLTPDKGYVSINSFSIGKQNDTARSDFRLSNIAYITQYHSLFEPIQLSDNLFIPYLFQKKTYNPEFGLDVAKRCLIDHKLESYPDELSAGEKQRATLALALTRNTKLLLADEPTANMDSDLAREVMNVLIDLVEDNSATFIMCSHDLTLLRPGFRHLRLRDGQIKTDDRVTKESLKGILKEYPQIENEDI